jgi:hypothetical protein
MKSIVLISDGNVDVDFFHDVIENPVVNAIEIIELTDARDAAPGDSVEYWTRIENPAGNTSDVTIDEISDVVTGPGGPETPVILTDCDPSATPTLAPGDIVWCSFSATHTGTNGETFTDVVSVDATFNATAGNADQDSNTVTVTVVDVAPGAPTGLNGVDGDATVALDWDDNAEPDFDHFEVFRGTAPGVDTTPGGDIGSPATSDWVDNTAVNGTIYWYAVVAVDAGGNRSTASETTGRPLPNTAVIERINAGGPQVTSTDEHQNWEADTTGANHPTLIDPGSNSASSINVTGRHASLPDYVPSGVFTTNERYGNATPFTYAIPVTEGQSVDVRLFLANNYSGSSTVGQRQFNVTIEGVQVLTNFDPVASFGHLFGGMQRFLVTESGADADSVITITFSPGAAENPLVDAIEIREAL